jgi:preprotein translocase subunit SecB
MTEERPANAATESGGNGSGGSPRQFALRRLYVKDLSFEAPAVPEIFQDEGTDPNIQLNLRTSHRDLGDDQWEVVLHVSAHATLAERTLFLVEIDQAGIFHMSGFPAQEARAVIGVACPTTLFPYAREAISSCVSRGGFPALLLQPIDFGALFSQASRKEQAQA